MGMIATGITLGIAAKMGSCAKKKYKKMKKKKVVL